MKLKRDEIASIYYGKHSEFDVDNIDNVIAYLNELDNYLNNKGLIQILI